LQNMPDTVGTCCYALHEARTATARRLEGVGGEGGRGGRGPESLSADGPPYTFFLVPPDPPLVESTPFIARQIASRVRVIHNTPC